MTEDVPDNGRIIRNLAMASNYLMSHILHFYHLLALDYVDVNGTGLIPKGFLCPNYDRKYYARGITPVLQTGPLPGPAYTVNDAPVPSGLIPPALLGDLTPYLAGQYVRALKMRRLAHQLGALFTGKMPHASCYTPGCVTTKPYDPALAGADAAVVQKVHEILYGGPAFVPTAQNGSTSGTAHPLNGNPISLSNPHPESLLGFIGKPLDFWMWAAGVNAAGPYDTAVLPIWAQLGWNPGNPLGYAPPGTNWQPYTGTYLFDAVAAAHVFPEYFWIGSGYGRFLAWGIFEGADNTAPDKRLITRGRVHIPQNPNGSLKAYAYKQRLAKHLDAKEFTTFSWYNDPSGINYGRHMWDGATIPNPNKGGAYTYAKTPRYYNDLDVAPLKQSGSWTKVQETLVHPDDKYLPYEVGPLARMMSNASRLTTPGGPATIPEATLVQNGAFGCYYPGILNHVDTIVAPALGLVTVGVMPVWGTNATAHLLGLVGLGVYYLPAGAIAPPVLANQYHSDYMGDAVLDRVAARVVEVYFVGKQMLSWFNQLNPANPSNETLNYTWGGKTTRTAPMRGQGAGLTEAPRGALGHWIKIGKRKAHPKFLEFRGKVSNYQIITPTAWNICPKDANDGAQKTLGLEGPIEKCINGTPLVDEKEPIEILRVIHSFDPCCACTVHVMNAKKEKVFEGTLEPTP